VTAWWASRRRSCSVVTVDHIGRDGPCRPRHGTVHGVGRLRAAICGHHTPRRLPGHLHRPFPQGPSSIAHGEAVVKLAVRGRPPGGATGSALPRQRRVEGSAGERDPDSRQNRMNGGHLQPLCLDEELSRLPDTTYRTVIVLSVRLDGRTRKEVARSVLGCPEAAWSIRLVRARSWLCEAVNATGHCLVGRGSRPPVPFPIPSVSSFFPSPLFSSFPAPLRPRTLFAAGQAVISSRVAALAEGVLKRCLLTNSKTRAGGAGRCGDARP